MVSGLPARVFPKQNVIELPAWLVAELTLPAGRVGWRGLALCAQVDPGLFYPEKGESPQPAKAVCARCEVCAACLAEALARREGWGVWGGLTARERAALLAAQGRATGQASWSAGAAGGDLAGGPPAEPGLSGELASVGVLG